MARGEFNFVPAALALMLLVATTLSVADADCTCQNNSKKDIVIIPYDTTVTTNIEVKAGATVTVPSTHQHCYLQNKDSGHTMGDYTLPNNQLIVVVDASVQGLVDVWVGGLLNGILQLVLNICVSL